MFNLALYAPRIPQNTGQIARAVWAAGGRLHLIRPLGFELTAAALKRASVGYLAQMEIPVIPSGEAFWAERQTAGNANRVWLVSKFGATDYNRVRYQPGDWLLFGNETEGLPPDWLEQHADRTVRIPMPNPEARCLNLATAAAVVLFEALRQNR